jgi:subtilisin-like proprotein convertase family protein
MTAKLPMRLTLLLLSAAALLLLGAQAASAKTKTATKDICVPSAAPIVDHGYAEQDIATGKLPKKSKVVSAKARIRITHTFVSDLTIVLVSPTGVLVTLANEVDGGGDNFGSGPADCTGTPTAFDDLAPASIRSVTSDDAPFASSYRPVTPLSALNGTLAAGIWRLGVTDAYDEDIGAINAFGLTITYQYPVKKKKKKK